LVETPLKWWSDLRKKQGYTARDVSIRLGNLFRNLFPASTLFDTWHDAGADVQMLKKIIEAYFQLARNRAIPGRIDSYFRPSHPNSASHAKVMEPESSTDEDEELSDICDDDDDEDIHDYGDEEIQYDNDEDIPDYGDEETPYDNDGEIPYDNDEEIPYDNDGEISDV
jgi:hypothetical protein